MPRCLAWGRDGRARCLGVDRRSRRRLAIVCREGDIERHRIDLFRAVVAAIRDGRAEHALALGLGFRLARCIRPSRLPLCGRLCSVLLRRIPLGREALGRVMVGPCRRVITGSGPTGVVTLLVEGGLA
jgi:hypothetical protein